MTEIKRPDSRPIDVPKELGLYIDRDGDLWLLNHAGWVIVTVNGCPAVACNGHFPPTSNEMPLRKCEYLEYR